MVEINERYFEMANTEFEYNRNSALWVKCLTLADGNETTARYKYISEVAQRLGGKGEHPSFQPDEAVDDSIGFFRKFIRGHYGMANTFWFGLTGYWIVNWLIRTGLGIAARSTSVAVRNTLIRLTPYELSFHFVIYCFLIVAVWRASLRYRGDFFWVIATRLVLVIFIGWLCTITVASYGLYLEAIGRI